MHSFAEAARDGLVRIGRDLAERMIASRNFVSNVRITAGAKRYAQPMRLIPGMPAAPEPCPLPGHWSAEKHPANAEAQMKIDGVRGMHVDTAIVTREALPLDCALHCLPALHEMEAHYGRRMVFDFEYQEQEGFQATLAALKRGWGTGTAFVFDAVPYDEWAANRFTEPFDERMGKLREALIAVGSPFLAEVGCIPVPTPQDAIDLAQRVWSSGHEGLVIKGGKSTYVRGKTAVWQKMKQRQTFDGPIVDALVKDNRCQAILVRLPSDSPTPGKVARVGSNLSEDLREAIGRDPAAFLDRIVEVGFTDTTDSGALRGGYFIRMRDDKGARS